MTDRKPRFHLVAGMVLPAAAFWRMLRDPQSRGPAVLVISLFLLGTAFYVAVEGWSVIDSFYFATMTLATVGFGDFVPTSEFSRLFTVFYVLAGVGVLVSFFSELAHATIDLRAELRARQGGPAAGADSDGAQSPPP